MATVKQVQEYLSTLPSDMPLLSVILTRSDFNQEVLQDNIEDIESDEIYAKFTKTCFDGDFEYGSNIGSLFVEYSGDDLFSTWVDFNEEEIKGDTNG
jgi:hypothetical protein